MITVSKSLASRFARIAFVLIFAAFAFESRPALSQGDAGVSTSVMERAIAGAFEEKARDTLGRHVEHRLFQIYATVAFAGTELPKVSYLPATSATSAFRNMDAAQLRTYAVKVALEIFIDPQINQDTRSKFIQLLNRSLALRPESGDNVTFVDMQVAAPEGKKDGAENLELAKLREELRAMQFRSEDLKKDREDKTRELQLAQAELQRQSRQMQVVTPNKPEKAEPPKVGADPVSATGSAQTVQQTVSTGPQNETAPPWLAGAGILAIAVALLFGLLFVGGGFRTIGKALSASVGSIAAALESISGNLGSSSGQQLGGELQVNQKITGQVGSQGLNIGQTEKITPEMAEKRISEFRQVLVENKSAHVDAVILKHINGLLSRPGTIEMGVATLEAMGEERAQSLFERLSKQKQLVVADFIRKGSASGSRDIRMAEAGEKLRSLLFVENFGGSKGKINEKVAELLIRISDQDLAVVATKVGSAALPRLLLYLDPKRIASLIETVKRQDESGYNEILQAITLIPDARLQSSHDGTIADKLDQALKASEGDFQREYLDFYKEIILEAGDNLAEEVADKLSAQHPRVKEFIEETIVSVGTFFRLAREYQEEILDYLGNRDIAALILNIDASRKAIVMSLLDERRKGLLDDDILRLQSKGRRQLEAGYEQVKRLIVAKITEFKGNDPVSKLLADQAAPLSGAPVTGGQNAA